VKLRVITFYVKIHLVPVLATCHDKKVPLNLYDQMIDDHIIFTNVVSNKNKNFQFYIFSVFRRDPCTIKY
jgi:hypothetical protein